MPPITASYSRLFISIFLFSVLCSVLFTVLFLNDTITYNSSDYINNNVYTIKYTRLPVHTHTQSNTNNTNNTNTVLNSRGTNVELGFAHKLFDSIDHKLINDMTALNITSIFPLYRQSMNDTSNDTLARLNQPILLQEQIFLNEFTDTYLQSTDPQSINNTVSLVVIEKYTELNGNGDTNNTQYGSKLSMYTRNDIYKLFDVTDTITNELQSITYNNPFTAIFTLFDIEQLTQPPAKQIQNSDNIIDGDWKLSYSDYINDISYLTAATSNNQWISVIYNQHNNYNNQLYTEQMMRVYYVVDNNVIKHDIKLHTSNKITAIDLYISDLYHLHVTYSINDDIHTFHAVDIIYDTVSNVLEATVLDVNTTTDQRTPYTETLLLQSYKLPQSTINTKSINDTSITATDSNQTDPIDHRIVAVERILHPQSNHPHYNAVLYHHDSTGYYQSQLITSFIRKLNAKAAHIASAQHYHKQYAYYNNNMLTADKHRTISGTSINSYYTVICKLPYITLIDSNMMLQPIEIIHLDRHTRFTQITINNNGDVLAILDNKPSIILLQRQQIIADSLMNNSMDSNQLPVYLSDNKWNVVHEIELPSILQQYAILNINLIDSVVDVPIITPYNDIDDIDIINRMDHHEIQYQSITITHLYILLENGIIVTYNLNTAELLHNTHTSIHESYENYTDLEYIILIGIPQLFIDLSLHYELLAFIAGMCTMLFFALPTLSFNNTRTINNNNINTTAATTEPLINTTESDTQPIATTGISTDNVVPANGTSASSTGSSIDDITPLLNNTTIQSDVASMNNTATDNNTNNILRNSNSLLPNPTVLPTTDINT